MAKVAIIKLFTGLNLAPAQLSGELQRAGHDSRIIYFKDYKIVPLEEKDNYAVTDYPGYLIAGDASKKVWNCYNPFNDKENQFLVDNAAMIAWTGILMHKSGISIKPENAEILPYERTDEILVKWR